MRKILTALGVLALIGLRQDVRAGQPVRPAAVAVTPVSGPSWLTTLGIDIRETSLGRGAGRYGPNPDDPAAERRSVTIDLAASVAVSGADLYRLNCQACHRGDGTGAPPEIKSVLPAVQGSTLREMSAALRQKHAQARADLYQRIEKGGQRMPPRAYMQRADVDLLFGYLTTLAGGRAAAAPPRKRMSVDRVGEFVVKGTCHICHDATGPRPSSTAILMQGRVPSLASVLTDKPIADFVGKVRAGGLVLMGNPVYPHRGRMPVFHYLSDMEIAAAYKYLSAHPPR